MWRRQSELAGSATARRPQLAASDPNDYTQHVHETRRLGLPLCRHFTAHTTDPPCLEGWPLHMCSLLRKAKFSLARGQPQCTARVREEVPMGTRFLCLLFLLLLWVSWWGHGCPGFCSCRSSCQCLYPQLRSGPSLLARVGLLGPAAPKANVGCLQRRQRPRPGWPGPVI